MNRMISRLLNRVTTHLGYTVRALCAASLVVWAAPSWAWKATPYTHVQTMNQFTTWYQSFEFQNSKKIIIAQAIIASPVAYRGTRPSAAVLLNNPDLIDNFGPFDSTSLANLRKDIHARMLKSHKTQSLGAKFLDYSKSGLFTDSQLNVFNQYFQPNLIAYQDFLSLVNPAELERVNIAVLKEETQSDRRLYLNAVWSGKYWDPSSTVAKEDTVEHDGRDRYIKLGVNKKRIERVALVNKRGRVKTWLWGPKYEEDNLIQHGATIDPIPANYENEGKPFDSEVYEGEKVTSTGYELDKRNLRATIAYYADQDIKQNGPLPLRTEAESRLLIEEAAEVATQQIGDPYIGYTIAHYAVRAISLTYLALVRNVIGPKKDIDFTRLAEAFSSAVDSDPEYKAAVMAATQPIRDAIQQSSFVLFSLGFIQSAMSSWYIYNVRVAVTNNPDATDYEKAVAVKKAYQGQAMVWGSFVAQMGALGIYGMPAAGTNSVITSDVLKRLAMVSIKGGFGVVDIIGGTMAILKARKDWKNLTEDDLRPAVFAEGVAGFSRVVGGVYTLGSYGAGLLIYCKFNPGNVGIVPPAIRFTTYTTAIAAFYYFMGAAIYSMGAAEYL
jgi:hypothetical protein